MSMYDEMVARFRDEIDLKDRFYKFKLYKASFTGEDAVGRLLQTHHARDTVDACKIGAVRIKNGVFRHVTGEHMLEGRFNVSSLIAPPSL